MPTAMSRDRVIFKDTVAIALATTNYPIVFPYPMPGPYEIYFQVPTAGLSVTGVTNVTANGFTISIAVTLASTLTYAAVEQRVVG